MLPHHPGNPPALSDALCRYSRRREKMEWSDSNSRAAEPGAGPCVRKVLPATVTLDEGSSRQPAGFVGPGLGVHRRGQSSIDVKSFKTSVSDPLCHPRLVCEGQWASLTITAGLMSDLRTGS